MSKKINFVKNVVSTLTVFVLFLCFQYRDACMSLCQFLCDTAVISSYSTSHLREYKTT